MQYKSSEVFPDVIIITPKVHKDDRGYFFESFQDRRYQEIGLGPFVQDNVAFSIKNTLRGLHYQLTHPQGKLVSVLQGRVYDVFVDIRQGSPTFGKWMGIELSEENALQVYVPAGFAHGYEVLSDTAYFTYKCTDYYTPGDEYGLAWNDLDLAIDWKTKNPLLSPKDQQYSSLTQIEAKHLPVFK